MNKTSVFLRNPRTRIRATVFIFILCVATALPLLENPSSVLAGSDTYPSSIGGCRAVSGNPSGYFTCDLKDSTQDAYWDPWAEENRECTSYVAWMLYSANGFTMPFNDNATNWGVRAQNLGYTVDMHPAVGSVFWSTSLDHVGWVESVSADGSTITYEDYNYDLTGRWAEHTGVATNSASGYIHFKDINSPLRIGVLTTVGSYLVKESDLGNPWVTEYNSGVGQGMQSGSLTGVIVGGGYYVKQGDLGNPWNTETGAGAVAGSLSDAVGTTPIRIGMLTNTGDFEVKEGLTGTWVTEDGGVVAGYVSGSRIAVLTTGGAFLVKDGGLGAPWVTEYGSGVTNGTINGQLIGINVGGTFYLKQGSLTGSWITEYGPSVSYIQLSDTTGSTPLRLGLIDSSGNFLVKEGVSGAWVTEYSGGVSQGVLSGNLVGMLLGGTFYVKQGALGNPWVNEYGPVSSGALWSPS